MTNKHENQSFGRKHSPKIAASALIGATVAIGLLPKGNAEEVPTQEVTAQDAPNPYFVNEVELESLTSEERLEKYVPLVAGVYSEGSNDGSISGLASDYGNVFGLDEAERDLVEAALIAQSDSGAAVHPGDTFFLPRLDSPGNPDENTTDQVYNQ